MLSHEGRVQVRLRTVGNKEGKYSTESVVSENSRTIVINLKEAGRKEELGNGSSYMKVQKKMTTMLANCNRLVSEQKNVEYIETRLEWIIQEAEFQTVAP